MKDSDGLQSLPQIKQASPGTSVIMLTTYANPGYLARAINSGASGYLSKETDPEQIVRAIHSAAAGDLTIDRSLLEAALSHVQESTGPLPPDQPDMPIEPLSDRENDVLALMVNGFNNSAIAESLSISVPTVKTHVQHILHKLHVSDRTQAALLAVRLGLVN
jgi:DNA-binding NarL/FixJ family response regulator